MRCKNRTQNLIRYFYIDLGQSVKQQGWPMLVTLSFTSLKNTNVSTFQKILISRNTQISTFCRKTGVSIKILLCGYSTEKKVFYFSKNILFFKTLYFPINLHLKKRFLSNFRFHSSSVFYDDDDAHGSA